MNNFDILSLVEIRRAVASGRARSVRTAARLSQAELAETIGVSQACVAMWETGKRLPRGAAALRYADTLRLLERATA